MDRVLTCALAASLRLLADPAPAETPRGTAEITLNETTMRIEYDRSSFGTRDLLKEAPTGFVWRLGHDRAATMSLTDPAVFGNMVVSRGDYSLFVERTAGDRWSLIVNAGSGERVVERDRSKDLYGIPLKWEEKEDPAERLSIELVPENSTPGVGILVIRWGRHSLRQRFRLPAMK